ncbi:hypothetical protein D3C72_1026490 [compost metagenome]
MRQQARRDRQAALDGMQRVVAAISHHRVRLRVERGGVFITRAAPPHHGQAIGQRRVDLGQQAREPPGKQRLGAGQLADIARLHEQPANQAP